MSKEIVLAVPDLPTEEDMGSPDQALFSESPEEALRILRDMKERLPNTFKLMEDLSAAFAVFAPAVDSHSKQNYLAFTTGFTTALKIVNLALMHERGKRLLNEVER